MKKVGRVVSIEGLLSDDYEKLWLFQEIYFALYPAEGLLKISEKSKEVLQDLLNIRERILDRMDVALLSLFYEERRRHIYKCKACYDSVVEALRELGVHILDMQKYVDEYQSRHFEEEHTNEA